MFSSDLCSFMPQEGVDAPPEEELVDGNLAVEEDEDLSFASMFASSMQFDTNENQASGPKPEEPPAGGVSQVNLRPDHQIFSYTFQNSSNAFVQPCDWQDCYFLRVVIHFLAVHYLSDSKAPLKCIPSCFVCLCVVSVDGLLWVD